MNNPLKKVNISSMRSSMKKFFNKGAFKGCCQKLTDFVYNNSKETALIMLIFNSVSILSGHISQIGGLKKSDRENKDYLITQEKKELGLDILLSVIPPFLINNWLMKKIDSGKIATKSSIEKLKKIVAPGAGAAEEDLFCTDHIIPVKQQVLSLTEKISGALLRSGKAPKSIATSMQKLNTFAKTHLPDPNAKVPSPTLENIATDFDNIRRKMPRNLTDQLYHGSAVDELMGQRNGLLIMATIGYSIIASNILMPILKNKLTNRAYEKEHSTEDISQEALSRRSRFKFNDIKQDKAGSPVFNDFFYKYSGDLRVRADSIDKFASKVNTIKQSRINNTFSTFSSEKISGMKI